MKKLNKLLLVALLLGVAYLAYSVVYWSGASVDAGNSAKEAGAAIASLIVLPSLLVAALAVVFNAIGLFTNKAGFALTAGILYSVAMLLFPPYFMFVIVEAILCYVAFAMMRKGAQAAA